MSIFGCSAPPTFVHVFFFEPEQLGTLQVVWQGESTVKTYKLFANIRAARGDEVKPVLVAEMRQAVAMMLGIDLSGVAMSTREMQSRWVPA
jgi:hypothetical protein